LSDAPVTPPLTPLTRRPALAHVLWIGGPTDAGKTSVARVLAARYDLRVYHYDLLDRLEPPGHWARVDPARHPHMHAALGRSREATWVETTPEALLTDWRRTAVERFALALEDLLALPGGPPVVAEGYGFLPALVAPLLTSPRQAVWLVPSDAFRLAGRARRGKDTLWADTSDPARARHNHLGRDVLIGHVVREQAHRLGLTVAEVDGTRSMEDLTARVAAHFASLLPPLGATAVAAESADR
jgi:hypothetical protein